MNELLELLAEWEVREDHDVGPGLHVSQAWLMLFGDGSGKVVAELGTVVKRDDLGVSLNNLLTRLGVAGRIERPFSFNTMEEAKAILSKPMKVNWDG